MTQPRFDGGTNIAMKIPAAAYEATVGFYRDTLALDVTENAVDPYGTVTASARVVFGPCTLWLDRIDNYATPEVWLELHTDDLPGAVAHLAANGTSTQDELEPFPDGTEAHWICNPVGVAHVLHEPGPSI